MNQDPSPKLCECGCGQPTSLASKTMASRGWIKGQPIRYRQGHGRRAWPWGEDLWRVEEREYLTPCWIWLGHLDAGGYGRLNREGFHSAHRYAWFRLNGAIPDDREIDHLCRVRACVNPSHMELVTRAENVRRSSNGVLSTDDDRKILDALARGETKASVARRFSVSESLIYVVVRRSDHAS